ncbi:MAG TPA: arsenate reductase (glutaredoxin) [Burkholderiaceae bacterium]|nr:arsenate reductase (glutaredoxin) [Burkholderiaceae bacterium]
MTTIFHNPRCSKSRAALERLREAGIEPEVIEYLKQPYTKPQLTELISRAGLSVRDIIRTSEAKYKELGLNRDDCSDDELLNAMVEHPVLVNRPIVVTDKGVRLGRPVERIDEIL